MRKMKDSGIPWIGEIPQEWDLIRTKNRFSNHKDIAGEHADDYERLALTLGGVIKRPKDDAVGLQPEAFNGYQILRKSELVFKLIDLANVSTSRVGYSPYTGIVSPAYIVLTPKQKEESRFGEYYFLSLWQSEIFNHMGDDGVRSSLNASDLLNVPYLAVPFDEQQRIVSFLDTECARIDAVMEQTRASIEEYKKLKRSIITEAVTKGIRPNRPMKDSGIDWIGQIPADWDTLRKLSYACNKSISYGIVKLFEPDDENGVKVLRCSDIREGIIIPDNIRTVTQKVSQEYNRTVLSGGEVVINVRGTLGGCAVVPMDMRGYNIAREVAMVSVSNCLANRYLMYYLLSKAFLIYEERHLAGSVYVGLNIEMLSACPIPLPCLGEQEEIIRYLDNKCQAIDTIITSKERFLAEMESYKKSLIFEYVTGKKEA